MNLVCDTVKKHFVHGCAVMITKKKAQVKYPTPYKKKKKRKKNKMK